MKIQSVINQLKSILLQIVSEGHIILAQQQLSLDLNLYQIVHTTFWYSAYNIILLWIPQYMCVRQYIIQIVCATSHPFILHPTNSSLH